MADYSAETGSLPSETAGYQEMLEPSIRNTLPHFMLLAVFPLVVNTALYGG